MFLKLSRQAGSGVIYNSQQQVGIPLMTYLHRSSINLIKFFP